MYTKKEEYSTNTDPNSRQKISCREDIHEAKAVVYVADDQSLSFFAKDSSFVTSFGILERTVDV